MNASHSDSSVPSINTDALKRALEAALPPLVIDVRRAPAYTSAADTLQGALRRDPADIEKWRAALPASAEVVVYCVHGHEVSQNAARALCAAGLRARFLEGGIEAWRAAGGALAPKATGAVTS